MDGEDISDDGVKEPGRLDLARLPLTFYRPRIQAAPCPGYDWLDMPSESNWKRDRSSCTMPSAKYRHYEL
jgi:hypothetical protein